MINFSRSKSVARGLRVVALSFLALAGCETMDRSVPKPQAAATGPSASDPGPSASAPAEQDPYALAETLLTQEQDDKLEAEVRAREEMLLQLTGGSGKWRTLKVRLLKSQGGDYLASASATGSLQVMYDAGGGGLHIKGNIVEKWSLPAGAGGSSSKWTWQFATSIGRSDLRRELEESESVAGAYFWDGFTKMRDDEANLPVTETNIGGPKTSYTKSSPNLYFFPDRVEIREYDSARMRFQ